MSTARVLVAVASVVLLFSIGACKKKADGDAKSKKGDTMAAASAMDKGSASKLSHKDNPKVGDSCKGLGATDGRMACDGNKKIFCSSYSKYKWKSLGECKGGKKCVLGPTGKSASCK